MYMDFRLHDDRDSKEHGVTLFEGKGRILVYLNHHENIEDIYSTIQHECIHWCIGRYNHAEIDDYQEHDLIFRIMWANDYIPDEDDTHTY
jgi:uncharacterized protein YjaZ